jgi:hypothetical protein
LLQVAGQKAKPFARFYGRPGQHDPLYPLFLQKADGLNRGQEGFAGARRTNRQGEVMAFNGVDEGPLTGGPGPERPALPGDGEHLASQLPMLFLFAGIKGRYSGLKINSRNRFAGFPEGLKA